VNLFSLFKLKSAKKRLVEEATYQKVVNEIANGMRSDGLWAKAMDKAAGNEMKTKALYIQYRVQSLNDEALMNSVAAHEQRIVAAIQAIVTIGCRVEGDENKGWRIISLKKESKDLSWKVRNLNELGAFAIAAKSI
jgi:hypothetical protein